MGLFGQTKPKDPRETVRELKKKMRNEQRAIDRNINHIKREELKVGCLMFFDIDEHDKPKHQNGRHDAFRVTKTILGSAST